MNYSKEDEFARELAEALDDPDGIDEFRKMIRLYSEENLRKQLLKVLSLPLTKVRNKAALFTFLVKRSSRNRNDTSRY